MLLSPVLVVSNILNWDAQIFSYIYQFFYLFLFLLDGGCFFSSFCFCFTFNFVIRFCFRVRMFDVVFQKYYAFVLARFQPRYEFTFADTIIVEAEFVFSYSPFSYRACY